MTGGAGRWKAAEGGAALRQSTIIVSAKGAARWQAGHPWIYRTDVYDEPGDTPGIVAVTDRRGRHLGRALYSPRSEIRLRLLTRGREAIDAAWWGERIAAAAARATKACPSKSRSPTARCRRLWRLWRGMCVMPLRPGPARKPARSSTSVRTACS